ncbi:MAG: hypothetical protein JRS35_28100, partial [Deltaproteobacteria bacterium]|nr:hypothetical protein [Deltaproteobacteria bacterium]
MKILPIAAMVTVGFLPLSFPATAATIHVPDDQPTIQAGIDAASHGDTVLVVCGTYYEHDITMKSGVCLRSETGEPGCVTIDAKQLGRVIYCDELDNTTRVEGMTLTGGYVVGWYSRGGGLLCYDSPITLKNCVITSNVAIGTHGG